MSFRSITYLLTLLAVLIIVHSVIGKDNEDVYRVKTVLFKNNKAFTDRELHRVMLNRPSSLFLPVTFNRSLLNEDLRQLELFYYRNGYLDAVIQLEGTEVDSVRHRVNIIILVEEGELTLTEGITIFGNYSFPDSLLQRKLEIAKGDALNRKKIENSVNNIINLYAEHGFIEANVQTEISSDIELKRAVIDFIIEENTRFKIGEVFIKGLEKTASHVVTRELLFETGEIINYSQILKSQHKLYLTGLFKSVFIQPEPGDSDDVKNLVIEVKESEYRELSARIGFGTIEKVRSKLEISNINLRGKARKIGLSGKISFIGRSLEANFTEPWTFATPWKTDILLITEFRDEPGYDSYLNSGKISCGRTIYKKISTIFALRIENVYLRNVETSDVPDDLNSRVRSVSNSVIRDTRNNQFNATDGTLFDLTSEFAGLFFSGTNSFTRFIAKYNIYIPLSGNVIIASSVDVGWMKSNKGGLDGIPLNERFYAGGPNSLRGFEYQMVCPWDNEENPIGGTFKLVLNLVEVRLRIYKMLGCAFFLDAGNVWAKPEASRIGSIRYSPGLGIRINTPIGLGRLDYGFNPERRRGEPPGMLYFSIGQAF